MRLVKTNVFALGVFAASLSACNQPPAPAASSPALELKEPKVDSADGVTLPAAQIAKLGIVTSPVRTTQHVAETTGFGVVQSHEAIAQAAADLVSAQAILHLSHSALLRARMLAGTPGAVSADVEETALQKEQIDAIALRLAQQKLSAVFGTNPPWKSSDSDPILAALAGGRMKLVRATFALGRLAGTPKVLSAERIDAGVPGHRWQMHTIWDAPADGAIPGRSFFALLESSGAAEGERLQIQAPLGAAEAGVVVPAAAAVLSGGKYWCYVERAADTFVKTEIDTTRPTADGYFVTAGIAAGARVVTAAAGQLLAVESGSSAEPD